MLCLQEARNIEEFERNFRNDASVKIPWVRMDLCNQNMLVMEWIDGIRCTSPDTIAKSGIDVEEFIRCGVVAGMRQLLEVWSLIHMFMLEVYVDVCSKGPARLPRYTYVCV